MVLVLDEELGSARLADALAQRGYEVTTVAALGLAGARDGDLLSELDARCEGPWVLATVGLGAGGASVRGAGGHAIAWIKVGDAASGAALERAAIDVMHRHAHAIAAQRPGTRRVYTTTQRRERS